MAMAPRKAHRGVKRESLTQLADMVLAGYDLEREGC
jgi:hypothetical protein